MWPRDVAQEILIWAPAPPPLIWQLPRTVRGRSWPDSAVCLAGRGVCRVEQCPHMPHSQAARNRAATPTLGRAGTRDADIESWGWAKGDPRWARLCAG